MPTTTRPRFADMRVADLVKAPAPAPADSYIVLLEEHGDRRRRLLVWIGGTEAIAMALRLAGMGRPARPLGADLSAALVGALGGRLVEVRIDRLEVELPPLPPPGGEGAPGGRAIVEELFSG
jgi:bifunctional DNase/RNase